MKAMSIESGPSKPVDQNPSTTPAPVKRDDDLKLFGFNLMGMTESKRFMLLASGALVCALMFAALQEKVFLIEGFHYSGYMTVLTTLTYMACALLERIASWDLKRKGSLRDYAILSIFTFAGMYMTNWSLHYLTYPTRVMFKSSKVIPVMLVSVVIVGRKYSVGEYAAAFMLVVGITFFTLADKGMPAFNVLGVILISLGVLADAITCNFEERRFFRNLDCSQAEVVLYSSAFGLVSSLATIYYTGELFDAVEHASQHPEVYGYTVMFSAMGYCSVVFVLLLIKGFGSTIAEIVKSCRKVMSIILSFILYSKPVFPMHVVGFVVFVGSILVTVKIKADRKRASKATAAASPAVVDETETEPLKANV